MLTTLHVVRFGNKFLFSKLKKVRGKSVNGLFTLKQIEKPLLCSVLL